MLLKKVLPTVCIFLLFSGITARSATEVITYTYNDSLEVIRTDYDGSIVVDYTYDGVGNRLARTVSTSGIPANNPPAIPSSASPSNGAVDVLANPVLSWAGSDPDAGDVIAYDLYLGTDSSPQLYYRGTTATSMSIDQRLRPMTTYYWKVVVRDNHNTTTEGPVWSFTTGNEAPSAPEAIQPRPDSSVDFANVYLHWSAGDPDIGDTLTYDIYFGESATPPLVQSDSSTQVYTVGALTAATTYYWQIVAKDSFGATTTGPVWSFQTTDQAPTVLNTNISTDTTLTAAGGPYLVSISIYVDAGVTLTIEPGTVIKVQNGMTIGVNGTLDAQGTVDNPIIITSYQDDLHGGDTNGDGPASTPRPGDWNNLTISAADAVLNLSYTQILYAGGSNSGAVYLTNGTATIDHCTIADSGGYGIYLYTGSSVISNNEFMGNLNYDIYALANFAGTIEGNTFESGLTLLSQSALTLNNNTFYQDNTFPVKVTADNTGPLTSTSTWHNVDYRSYLEVNGGTISRDATWPALMPYHILGTVTVQGTDGADSLTTLTVAPGAELRFNQNLNLNIGSTSGDPGALSAIGTAAATIVFTATGQPSRAATGMGSIFIARQMMRPRYLSIVPLNTPAVMPLQIWSTSTTHPQALPTAP
jgi:hypothetical protein